MQIHLGLVPRNTVFRLVAVLYLNPDHSLPLHKCHYKSKVKAPDHDNGQDDTKRNHNEAVIDFKFINCFFIDIAL